MSYTRDPDAASRGVGAIASIDHALPAAARRRAQIARALKKRDRAMAAVAMGALGSDHRASGPMAPSTPPKAPTSATFTNADGSKTLVRDHRTNPQPITAPPPPSAPRIDPLRVPIHDEAGALTYTKTRVPVSTAPPTRPPPPPPGTAPPPPAALVPVLPQPTPGAGTVGAGGSIPTPPIAPPTAPIYDPVPQLPDPGLTAGGGDDGTMKMLMIAGGAALVAFLIFRNRGQQ